MTGMTKYLKLRQLLAGMVKQKKIGGLKQLHSWMKVVYGTLHGCMNE
jgi:hypothetical protein